MFKILIDPGHANDFNRSPVDPNYYESHMTWNLFWKYKAALEQYEGVKCGEVDNRSAKGGLKYDPKLWTRGTAAKGYDMFISLHSNDAGAEAPDYPLVITAMDGNNDVLGLKVAQGIQKVLNTKQKAQIWHKENSRGTEYYGVLRGAQSVGCKNRMIIEHSFHSNKRIVALLQDETILRELAESFAKICAEYYGWKKKVNGKTEIVKPPQFNNTSIIGQPTVDPKVIATWAKVKNPKINDKLNCTIEELCSIFVEEGKKYNIRGDVAFCQSAHETGWFKYGNIVTPEMNNYCGLGAVNNAPTGTGGHFATPTLGVRAQIQHLLAYANRDAEAVISKVGEEIVDPRFKLVTKGVAPNWTDLDGRWAVPGVGYGMSILTLFNDLLKFANSKGEKKMEEKQEIKEQVVEDKEPSAWAKEAWDWAVENKLLDGTKPKSPLTREQAASILYRIAKAQKEKETVEKPKEEIKPKEEVKPKEPVKPKTEAGIPIEYLINYFNK